MGCGSSTNRSAADDLWPQARSIGKALSKFHLDRETRGQSSRLTALQTAMDTTVGALNQRVAEQTTLLETEAARRNSLSVTRSSQRRIRV